VGLSIALRVRIRAERYDTKSLRLFCWTIRTISGRLSVSMYVCACISQYSVAWHSGALQNYTVAEPCNVDGVDTSQVVATGSLLVCGTLEMNTYGTVFGFLSETSFR
jgi:hypothetical protein